MTSIKKKTSVSVKKTSSKSKIKNLQISTLEKVFSSCGFKHIPSDGIHFYVNSRQGEIDHIFAYENLLLLCEETSGQEISAHFAKKKLFHQTIQENRTDFFKSFIEKNIDFKNYCDQSQYLESEFEIRSLYFSEVVDAESGLLQNCDPLKILTIGDANYFQSLAKTIGSSARFEMLKYLGITLGQIGQRSISGGSSVPSHSYNAFVLTAAQTNFPSGFGIVSFYADPDALIRRAYVMRKDGWESPEISYQRFLKPAKLSEMRKHLANDEKVFINNLIVTLPSDIVITDKDNKSISLKDQKQVNNVRISIPDNLGSIGIIDGQHRIFSYHEGTDESEAKISKLRTRQNLLVTGLVFPENYTELEKVQFEAKLFLGINDTQTKVSANLKQEIQAIIHPYSTVALSKSVINALAKKGPLADKLQKTLYDTTSRIRTSSLVQYVLAPIMKSSGTDTLFHAWKENGNSEINSAESRAEYLNYCETYISKVLIGAKKNIDKEKWALVKKGGLGILSPTTIGGFVFCLRELIGTNVDLTAVDFDAKFAGLNDFEFGSFRSSRWSELSKKLHDQFLS